MPRAKKHLQGKEEVARQMEVERKRKIVTEQFYPALTGATVSVDEAKMLISSISTLMMEDTLQTMKERKFSEISKKLLSKLCPDGSRETEVKALLDVFDTENLFTTRELVEGMNNAIEQMILEDMQNRTLNSFTPNWGKMLNK